MTTISNIFINDTDTCNPLIVFEHSAGCPVANVDTIIIFMDKYPWVWAVFLFTFGPLFAFFGWKFIKLVVGLSGGLATAFIIFVLCSALGMLDYIDPTKSDGNAGLVALSFILSLGLGVLAGFLLYKFMQVGLYVLAFVGGYLFGGLVYNFLLVSLNSQFLLGFTTFGCAFGLAVLTQKW